MAGWEETVEEIEAHLGEDQVDSVTEEAAEEAAEEATEAALVVASALVREGASLLSDKSAWTSLR